MAAKTPIWGIDVGQCSLKAIKLQQVDDKVELLGFDLIEHEKILSQAGAEEGELVTKAIEKFASDNDLKNSRIVVSVPGQQTLTRFTKMPPVEKKKLPDMVQYEASQQIPFDMDEVVWDYQVLTEGEAAEVEVGIFAIRKELIRSYLTRFTEKGLEPIIVQASPMASYNTLRYELDLPEGDAVILLDMGALTTDLIVMEGSRIWSRPMPIGGNRFTEALVSAFKIPFEKAERLKRAAATSKYSRQIFQAMRPVFADLVSEVQRSIGFYTSTHREARITRVIGMGNAFKLPGLQKFLHQNLQIQVDRFSGFKKLIATDQSKKSVFDENVTSLSVAHGLALQGLGLAAVNVNLLPIEIRRTLLWAKKKGWFGAAAACLAVAAGTMWVGNVTASGEIQKSLGNIAANNIRATTFSNPEQAMAAINSPAGGAAVERAVKVLGAAKQLKQAFDRENKTSSDEATLKKLVKFPRMNLMIPRIIDVIHRSLDRVASAELRAARTADEYRSLASQIGRKERKEVWIEKLEMIYNQDPSAVFGKKGKSRQVRASDKGWAIKVTGVTTEQRPAKWLEENLISSLIELGRAPDRGFHFDTVSLGKVSVRGKPKKSSGEEDELGDGRRRRGRDRRGGGGPTPPGGGGGGGPTAPGGDR